MVHPPFPPLGVRGRPRFQEKFAPPGTQVPVRSSAACICGTQRLVAALRLHLKHTIIMGQLQLQLCQCGSKKRGLVLDKPRGIVYTENTEGAGPYKRLAPYHCVKSKRKMTALGWGTSRRSFFLFIITVRDSPCDLKCNVDCSAKQRKQHYDLFKRHGASPLSALGRPGEAEISRKIRSTGHSGAGKELSRLHLWDAAPRGSLAAAFKAYHNYGPIAIAAFLHAHPAAGWACNFFHA